MTTHTSTTMTTITTMTTPIMYIFINTSLKMTPGKVAGQVGHLVQNIMEELLTLGNKSKIYKRYLDWKADGCTKIVLKATQEQINELIKMNESFYIIDAGRTQIDPGSLTVVGFYPVITKAFTDYKLF